MPVYNGDQYLAHTLESLLAQTFTDFELIISDNGSDDRTESICREYVNRDSRVRYIRHSTNRGAAWNWNYVVHQARGNFLKWASANDYYDSRMIEKCMEVLRCDASIALCYPMTWMVQDGGAKDVYDGDIDVLQDRASTRFMHLRRHLKMNNAQAGVIRLSMLRRTRLERSYPNSDMILMAELALYGKYRLLSEPLLFRRVDPQSISRNLSAVDLQHFIDPSRPPRLALVTTRSHIDSAWSVVRARVGVAQTLEALGYILKRAFRERGIILREFKTLIGMSTPN
jgi:glycosyltransferase involved in cell wall biosynthesis